MPRRRPPSPPPPPEPAAVAPAAGSFAAVVGPVRALRARPATVGVPPPPPRTARGVAPPAPDVPVAARAPGLAAHALEAVQPDSHVQWRRPGVPDRTVRALGSLRFAAQLECDLHGLPGAGVAAVLDALLAEAAAVGAHRLRVVHGRGRGALKRACVDHLCGHPAVLALRSAGPADGGAGALRVLTRTAETSAARS